MRSDLQREKTATLGLETDHVRRTPAARFSFAKGFDQIRRKKIANDIGHRWRAQAGGSHQISSRAGPDFAQKLEDRQRVGVTEIGGSADRN